MSRMPKEELPEKILNKSAKDGKIESIKRVEMFLFVRTDLGMTKGKQAAQCGHAVLGAFKMADQKAQSSSLDEAILCRWMQTTERKKKDGQIKLSGGPIQVNFVKSEAELSEIYAKALQAKLPCKLVRDAGRTQIAAGSVTVCGVGPMTEDHFDRFIQPK